MGPRLAWMLLCIAAVARADDVPQVAQLAQRFPPGSLATREMADAALAAADDTHERVARQFEAERERCMHRFFVNHCLDAARAEQRRGEHEVRRVTLEAHDLRRLLDAQAHVQDRTEQLRRQAADELLRPEREREALEETRRREAGAAARAADAERDSLTAAKAQADTERKQREQGEELERKDSARPAAEAEAQRAFQVKQEQAADYAQTRADDRAANAKRREQRQAERDAAAKADAAAAAAHAKPPAPGTGSATKSGT